MNNDSMTDTHSTVKRFSWTRLLALVVGGGLVLWLASAWKQKVLTTPLDDGSDTESLVQAVIDSQKSEKRTVVAAEDVRRLDHEDVVIGVAIDGEARAYPVQSIAWSGHLNDSVGDVPICVTWCTGTGSGAVWHRQVNSDVLTFAYHPASGRSGLVLYDVQTRSVWSQLALKAQEGPLHGSSLKLLPVIQTTWGNWRRLQPQTSVVFTSDWDEESFRYRQADVRRSADGDDRQAQPTRFERVLALPSGSTTKAYPFSDLASAAIPLIDTLDEQAVRVYYDPTSDSAWATNDEGVLLSSITAYWGGWRQFHPQGKVHRPQSDDSPAVP